MGIGKAPQGVQRHVWPGKRHVTIATHGSKKVSRYDDMPDHGEPLAHGSRAGAGYAESATVHMRERRIEDGIGIAKNVKQVST